MYSKFEQQLQVEAGINFNTYISKLRAAGNETGIYADVALLLYRIVADPSVNSFIEFGSGMSTCVINNAARKYNKETVSMELLQKWFKITRACMKSLDLPTEGYYCTEGNPTRLVKVTSPIDVAFIDGPIMEVSPDAKVAQTVGRIEACKLYQDYLREAVLIFDDAQSISQIQVWLREFGRGPELEEWFNPTGRSDRHELISYPTASHPLRQVVQSCRL